MNESIGLYFHGFLYFSLHFVKKDSDCVCECNLVLIDRMCQLAHLWQTNARSSFVFVFLTALFSYGAPFCD